jgi:hypothetical protein
MSRSSCSPIGATTRTVSLASSSAPTTTSRDRQLADRYKTPRERLLGVFDVQALTFSDPGFHGCAFARASAEAPEGTSIEDVSEAHRAWLRSLFVDLAKEAGTRNPEQLARQLMLLYDGAAISAWMDHNSSAATAARSVATTLVDAAIPKVKEPAKSRR